MTKPLFSAEDFDNGVSDLELEDLPFYNEDFPEQPSLAQLCADIADAKHEAECPLKAENARLREALDFFADIRNYIWVDVINARVLAIISEEPWVKARAALEGK